MGLMRMLVDDGFGGRDNVSIGGMKVGLVD